jgi:DNA-binding NtrC family response regulator
VDDDTVTCELLCEVFAREGFEAASRQSGEAALAAISHDRPAVLLSDIRMKTQLDGLSLLDRMRDEHPSIPVVLMTAFGSIETAIRAVKEGAFDYLSKPFNIDELVATVRRAVAARDGYAPDTAARRGRACFGHHRAHPGDARSL